MATVLTADQEAQAQQLAAAMKEKADEHFLAVARILVATEERTLFGQTELNIRDQFLKLTGQAYTLHLAQKKRLPRVVPRLPEVRPRGPVPRLS